jgi:DNA-binding GntR family transcriptional regulator
VGGLDLSQDAVESLARLWANEALTGATSDIVYRVLSEAIIAGVLPPGQRLTEEQLASLFDVSRTPVREAIVRLEAEHFAVRVPRRGLVVSQITPQVIIDVYSVRGAIDGLAAALAAEHATSADISMLSWINEQFAAAADADDIQAMADLNLQLHEAIAKAARNSLLSSIVQQVHHIVRRFRSTTFTVPGRGVVSVAEHRAVIDAIAARDTASARLLAESHMAIARQIRIEMLNEREDGARESASLGL